MCLETSRPHVLVSKQVGVRAQQALCSPASNANRRRTRTCWGGEGLGYWEFRAVERAGSNEGQTAELASSLAERTKSGEKIYQLNRSEHSSGPPFAPSGKSSLAQDTGFLESHQRRRGSDDMRSGSPR